MKKVLLGLGAAGITLAMIPLFAAFEAHVVNVTARIENALRVSTDDINFGTVFPQEHLNKPLTVALSGSFIQEPRVDDVNYFIRQKPKCGVTTDNGTVLVGPTATGHVIVDPATGQTSIDCGKDPRPVGIDPTNTAEFGQPLPLGSSWGVLPSLCEYISKEGEERSDGITPSFHQPWTVVLNDNSTATTTDDFYEVDWLDTPGYLSKLAQDTVDNWVIDLSVPCFGGFCAQDWADFVHGINPQADPAQYTQPITNEHKVFGCDLWVEVGGVSLTPPPPVPGE